jgi:hypothetical protein
MNRGRLVWSINPETDEMVGSPVFEAGHTRSCMGITAASALS